ncbi:MAG: hypothetical protein NTZ05_12755 [Chloroflexi bacterium]|nr:hypothetical protein [Chloroflexota bacterium]
MAKVQLRKVRQGAAIGVFFLIAATFACAPQPGAAPSSVSTPTPASPAPVPTAPASPTARLVPASEPTPSANITIATPAAGAQMDNAVQVTGRARVCEGSLQVEVKDAKGAVLGSVTAQASSGAPEWGAYNVRVPLSPGPAGEGRVEAFSLSARDGSVQNLVGVAIHLAARTGTANPIATPTKTP